MPTPRRLSVGATVAIVALFIATALIATWDLPLKLGTHLDRSTKDTLVHVWNNWWVARAVTLGRSPFYSDALYFPGGVSLVTHNIAWLNVLVSLVLAPLVGAIAAYNLGILLSLSLCGLTSFLLVRRITGNDAAALIGALVYQLWPYRLAQIGHPNMLATQWIPLFVLFLLQVLERRRLRDSLAAGAAFAMVGYTRWQLMIGAAVMGAVCVATSYLIRRDLQREGLWYRLSLIMLVATLMLLPPLALLAEQQLSPSTRAQLVRPGDEENMQVDLLAYLLPGRRHPIVGDRVTSLYERFYGAAGRPYHPAYLGVVTLILVAVGLRSRRKELLPWLVMAAVLMILALGPVLRVGGKLYPGLPMPYRLLQKLSLFSLMRYPRRYNMFLALPVSILAGHGVARLIPMWRNGHALRNTVLVMVIGVGLFVDYASTPLSLGVAPLAHPFVEALAEEPGEFAVLNLPRGYTWDKYYMMEQTVHDRPIVGGHVSRSPNRGHTVADLYPDSPLLGVGPPDSVPLCEMLFQIHILEESGVRYIILHKEYLSTEDLEAWRREMRLNPTFEDDVLLVYDTRLEPC